MVNDRLITGLGDGLIKTPRNNNRGQRSHSVECTTSARNACTPKFSRDFFSRREAIVRQAFFSYELLALVYVSFLLFGCGVVGHIFS